MRIIWKILDNLEEYIASSLLIGVSVLIFVQVVLRYVFSYSIYWSSEASIYLIIWFIFIGSSIAIREKAHVTVDVVVEILPPVFKKLMAIIAYLVSIGFCIMMLKAGVDMVMHVGSRGITTAAMGVPMSWAYLAVPVGFSLMLIRFSQALFTELKGFARGSDAVGEGGKT